MLAGKLFQSIWAADWKVLPPSVTKVLILAVSNLGTTLYIKGFILYLN